MFNCNVWLLESNPIRITVNDMTYDIWEIKYGVYIYICIYIYSWYQIHIYIYVYMISHIYICIYDIIYTYMRYLICDMWYVICDWTSDIWYVICDLNGGSSNGKKGCIGWINPLNSTYIVIGIREPLVIGMLSPMGPHFVILGFGTISTK